MRGKKIITSICLTLMAALVLSLAAPSVSKASSEVIVVAEEDEINAVAGSTVPIVYTIFHGYKNEKINIKIYSDSGTQVLDYTQDFSNYGVSYETYTFNWITTGMAVGRYKVVEMTSFYSFFEWHNKAYTVDSYVNLSAAGGNAASNNSNTSNSTGNANGNTAATDEQYDDRVTVYRLYNKKSGEHLYTMFSNEKDALVKSGWTDETKSATPWYSAVNSDRSIPVYRLYNPNTGLHHFSMTKAEIDNLVKAGWKNEGVRFYSTGKNGQPVYRQYNPKSGLHNYTTNLAENNYLVSQGWRAEGIAWYGVK